MSKSVLLKSSIAKKYWMALTGLFLCLFLLGHLLGNLQLFSTTEEGRRAFNEYAYFMTHNPLIKVMSYMTYLSILFHAIDGILLTIQNKKARPINYAYNNSGANSKWASRNMALLGSVLMLFIIIHMANFWWKMKHSSDPFPLHTFTVDIQSPAGKQSQEFYYAKNGNLIPKSPEIEVKNGNELYSKQVNVKIAEGYKDLYSLVYSFFGHKKNGFDTNEYALPFLILYVVSMLVLSFHLMHGFSSAFQSLGLNHRGYNQIIKTIGKAFAFIVPVLFAIIPIYIYLIK
ncbi:MAG: succinate dehydrogenase cytochrome b subunit [Flavobacteriia bacterium]|nr:succinate dehydrogenase cytochrome b subunit [Flavobacteriia bacterium]